MSGFVPDASRSLAGAPWPERLVLRRRTLLAGGLGGAMSGLGLAGCQTLPGLSLVEAIRRLLLRSSEQGFATLTAPGGYWDEAVAGLGVANLLGLPGGSLTTILASNLFKERLEGAFARIAAAGASRAAPLVAEAVRGIGIANALALVRGGPEAATAFLRESMGTSLIEAMVPELGQALRLSQDPLVAQLLGSLAGIDVGGAARNLAGAIDRAIWAQIAREESAIRANPRATGDPLLIGVFAPGAQP